MESEKKLVDIKSAIRNKALRAAYSLLAPALEGFLGIRKLNAAYVYLRKHPEHGNFFERAIHAIGVNYEVDEDELKKIPSQGPLIIVSNHPLGGLDGILMGAALLRARPDAKVIVNSLLARMEEIKEFVIEVNPFGGKSATVQNIAAMKETIRHLKNGGCVGTFPSGTVSYLHIKDCCISDPEWNANIAQIARKTGANIIPVFFEGRNSLLFYLSGLIHPSLRTLLLVREMFRTARKVPVRMHIGSVISARNISEFKTDEELISWLRINSYILGGRNKRGEAQDYWQKNLPNDAQGNAGAHTADRSRNYGARNCRIARVRLHDKGGKDFRVLRRGVADKLHAFGNRQVARKDVSRGRGGNWQEYRQ